MLELWLGGVLGAPLVIAKLAPLLADLALGWLVWLMLRERGPRVALLGAAAIVFNPAFWFLSAIWGQIDSVYVLLMVASIAALAVDRFGTSWAAWTAGVLWKLQALVIGPLVVVGDDPSSRLGRPRPWCSSGVGRVDLLVHRVAIVPRRRRRRIRPPAVARRRRARDQRLQRLVPGPAGGRARARVADGPRQRRRGVGARLGARGTWSA